MDNPSIVINNATNLSSDADNLYISINEGTSEPIVAHNDYAHVIIKFNFDSREYDLIIQID